MPTSNSRVKRQARVKASPDGPGGPVTGAVVVDAPAKVNLFLRVLGRRGDGYRELETIFQALSLADRVRVEVSDEADGFKSAHGTVTLEVDGPDLGPPESNLALRAARRFQEVTGCGGRVHIRLTKNIPAGAGLGGGSSDAAGVLRCLASLEGLDDREVLFGIACELGSDVAFFLGDSPLALARGRGEILTSMTALPEAHLVLALPPVHVSTAAAYAALPPELRGEARTLDLNVAQDWEWMVPLAQNDFEAVVSGLHEEVRLSLEGLRASGAAVAQLSGSGSASFGIFLDPSDAERAAGDLTQRFAWPFLMTRTRTSVPRPTRVEERG